MRARIEVEIKHITVVGRLLRWAAAHPVVLVVLAFLFASAFGGAYNAAYLARFQIDFFLYAAPEDLVFGWVRNPGSRLYLTLLAVFLLGSMTAFVAARALALRWLSDASTFDEQRLLTRIGSSRIMRKLNAGTASETTHPFAQGVDLVSGLIAGLAGMLLIINVGYQSEPFLFFHDWADNLDTLTSRNLDSVVNAVLIGPLAGAGFGLATGAMAVGANRLTARSLAVLFYAMLAAGSTLHFGRELNNSAQYQAECVRNVPAYYEVQVTLEESTAPQDFADRLLYPIGASLDFMFFVDRETNLPIVLARSDIAAVERPLIYLDALGAESFEDTRSRELWERVCL